MVETIPFVAREDEADKLAWISALAAAMPAYPPKLFEQLSDAERAAARVAIVADPDPKDLLKLPNLQWVHSVWAGVERLVTELPHTGPKIVRLKDPQMAKTMAEAVLAWTLYLHRDMPRYRRQQDDRVWQKQALALASERTVGLLGMGKLGSVAAGTLLDQGFRVCGWSRTAADMGGVQTFHGMAELDGILSISDILVVLLPLTAQTHGLLDAQRLSALPRGASVINFSRGPIVETDALVAQLDRGHLDHAVLDVFDHEPLPAESPLWHHPRITVLPHISAPTTLSTSSAIVAENLRAFFETGELPETVDRKTGY
ncbi:MAG: glyoxylate/hydroxypyruvate reductase A [Pseudomonadota bacterium]